MESKIIRAKKQNTEMNNDQRLETNLDEFLDSK